MEEQQERERPKQKWPGVEWHHGSWRIGYYGTDPATGRRIKHREVTDCTSAREAAKLRARRMEEHRRGERTVDTGKVTVGDLIAAVLTDYEVNGRRSLPTAKGHAKAIKAARNWLAPQRVGAGSGMR